MNVILLNGRSEAGRLHIAPGLAWLNARNHISLLIPTDARTPNVIGKLRRGTLSFLVVERFRRLDKAAARHVQRGFIGHVQAVSSLEEATVEIEQWRPVTAIIAR